jgi:hypothetical protein
LFRLGDFGFIDAGVECTSAVTTTVPPEDFFEGFDGFLDFFFVDWRGVRLMLVEVLVPGCCALHGLSEMSTKFDVPGITGCAHIAVIVT